MKIMPVIFLFLGAASVLAPAAAAVQEQTPIGADGQLPPALRNRPRDTPPAAAGAALRAQALAKLEAQFKAADLNGDGQLSPEEAKGFGFVARHFDDIDTARRGAVSFDDLRMHLARAKADRR
ncbi:EF-hand domain-containing protein [Massilia sp. Dwa41.01b]|uniref:EF-hand domain-containing protein n=1 Tax=Massilia sp. Dwa41.01b TaxID=2709302 RepID=UPI0016017095|nr:EF-hand domain-containing protein [Massilia sp. Dwa41.01b]QNA89620.1 EF-hand domain-containing protein [Massilia sp. Dwa41.01b]